MKETSIESSLLNPEVWVDEYGDSLYRFALSRIKDTTIAEELVQETFLSALKSMDNFKGRSSVKTWLIAILKHKIIDHFRKKKLETTDDDMDAFSDSVDQLFGGRGQWSVKPNNWQTNPGKTYEQQEFLDTLYRCLSDLPERHAKAFTLREIEGFDTEDICKILNINATNCWVMLYRARMHLRRCLELNWFEKKS